MDYYYQESISQRVRKQILYYYKELYDNYEMKTVSEIAADIGTSYDTIYKFIDSYCSVNIHSENCSLLTVMVMTCTIFNKKNQFYSLQQERFSELIKRRKILKEVKMHTQKLNKKRQSKKL